MDDYRPFSNQGYCMRDRSQLSFGIPRIVVTIIRDSVFIAVLAMTSVVTFRTLRGNNESADHKTASYRRKVRRRLSMINMMQLVFGLLVIPYDIFDCFMQIVVMADLDINFE